MQGCEKNLQNDTFQRGWMQLLLASFGEKPYFKFIITNYQLKFKKS